MKLLERIFKKAEGVSVALMSNKEIVEKIHSEFNGAGEALLKEANEILNGEKFSTDKADLLKKVGFRNVPEVKEIDKKIEKKELSDSLVNAIQLYKLHYPKQKFITKEMVDAICQKYNLICGNVSAYKGFVPLKNLKEIEAFNIKPEHCDYQVFFHESPYKKSSYNEYAKEKNRDNIYYSSFPIRANTALLICAPAKDMELTSRQKVQGNWIIEIPDPVVLHPVPEGFLILTAWGEEASDPLVVNNDMVN